MIKTAFNFLLVLVLCSMHTQSYSQIVNNPTELSSAINSATPGTTIILANGIWADVFIDIDKNATSAAPITITAQNAGEVLMTGNSRVHMEGAYLIVSGLVFQDPANLVVSSNNRIEPVIELSRCDNCKILNNKIDHYNGTESQKKAIFKWILNDGLNNEIAYNSFIGKYGVGSIINDNRNNPEPDFLSIHHNYFADRTPINEVNEDNDQDAIRMGSSTSSLDDSFSEVYANYFYNFFGEVEIISNKSGQNKYYNNTFRDYSGTLTLRHGNNCEVYGNYFFAEGNLLSGGVRVIGEGHKIYNNYVEGINSIKPDGSRTNTTAGVNISNGQLDSELSGYFQVKNTQVVNNTFVNCDFGLRIGTRLNDSHDQAPLNLTVVNNISYNSTLDPYQIVTAPIGTSITEGNILDLDDEDLEDDGDFHRLTENSTPIEAGIGEYTFLTRDILGGERETTFDAGAEEYGANGLNLPYNTEDVGLSVGFGAVAVANPSLSTSLSQLDFGKDPLTLSFFVISNLDWEITEDIPWLSLDITEGSGTRIISATVAENTTGAERSANISISERAGGSNLSIVVQVLQSDQFLPLEIPVVATTSVGMQDKEGISEENAYNDDTSNYWTGNPDTETEVSITFDLSCLHILTEIGINFWKADERTTSFSIAVSEELEGPYTTIIDTESSMDTTNAHVDTEQLFSLDNAIARYVKFIGIGNSSDTNWTSIANVNIYGNPNCAGTTSVFNNEKIAADIRVYPIPSSDGLLNISIEDASIDLVEIYDSRGKFIEKINTEGKQNLQVDISSFNAGIYFLKLDNLGITKFIIAE